MSTILLTSDNPEKQYYKRVCELVDITGGDSSLIKLDHTSDLRFHDYTELQAAAIIVKRQIARMKREN